MRIHHLLLSAAILTFTATAHAEEAPEEMVPVDYEGASFMAPQGWAVEANPGEARVKLSARPEDPTSPSVLIKTFPAEGGDEATERFAARSRKAINNPTLVTHIERPTGASVDIWAGSIQGVSRRVAILQWEDEAHDVAMTAVFSATPGEFEQLGGASLLCKVLQLSDYMDVPQTLSQRGDAPQGLDVPEQYRRSATPTLYFIAEHLHELSAAQIAAGMKHFNKAEHEALAMYSAFGNLLHGIACGADNSVTLYTMRGTQSCEVTMRQWHQTFRLLEGDDRAALDYAFSQREGFLVSERCAEGALTGEACNTYLQARRHELAHNRTTMTRVVANLSNGCISGNGSCVAY